MTRSDRPTEAGEVTTLLRRARDGEAGAFDQLVPLVYDALTDISRRQLRRAGPRTLDTTELVHETYVKLARQEPVDALRYE